MTNSAGKKHKKISPDWLVQGILTKIGDSFDRITGRMKKPAGSLATSELIEKLKHLLDNEVKFDEHGRGFIPHNIKLKMEWGKFSTDSEKAIKKLEIEFLSAIIDHIDEKRYYTYAPLAVEIKPDYFIKGVKLFASFDKFTDENREAEISVALEDDNKNESEQFPGDNKQSPHDQASINVAFTLRGERNEIILDMPFGVRFSIGRTKENAVPIDDISVSKHHASLLRNGEGKLLVADVGSTNGTFINGNRISYGEACEIKENDVLRLGDIEVLIQFSEADKNADIENSGERESIEIGNLEIKRRMAVIEPLKITDENLRPDVESERIKEITAEGQTAVPPENKTGG